MSWIDRVMRENSLSYEVIMIDDGSKDKSWSVIEHLSALYPGLRGIKFSRNYGKSAALNVGFGEAMGDVVITMDADLQDSPDEVPELYKMITRCGLPPSGVRVLRAFYGPSNRISTSRTRRLSRLTFRTTRTGKVFSPV